MTAKRLKESDMDFKALMTKLETIDKRQVLNESTPVQQTFHPQRIVKENDALKSSIARMLMQEFGIEEAEAADDGIERNADAVDSQGNPIRVASGGNLKSAGPAGGQAANPPEQTPELQIGQGREDQLPSDDARSPDGQSGMSPTPPIATVVPVGGQAANPPADEPAPADQGAEAGAPPAQYDVDQAANIDSSSQSKPADAQKTIDPTKLARFKELLDKAEKGSKTPPAPQPAAQGSYQIKPGDNLTKIAKAYGTTIDALMKLNPQIKNPNLIYAGHKMNVPAKESVNVSEDDAILSMIRAFRV